MKSYRHTGTQPLVLDAGRDADGFQIDRVIEPGAAFDAELTPEHEATLIKARAIRVDAAPVNQE